MNKDIKKLFSGITNALAKYSATVESVLSTYRRECATAAQTASKFKDEAAELQRLKAGSISKARAALQTADKELCDDMNFYHLPKLRESLGDHLMEKPDNAFIATLRLYRDFGLTMSKAELTALLQGAGGNYCALRCLQSAAKDSGYSLRFPGVEDFQRDIETIARLAYEPPVEYAPLDYVSELKEIIPQSPIRRQDGSIAYTVDSNITHLILRSQEFSSAWKNMGAISDRWSAAIVPSIDELKPERTEDGETVSIEEQHEKNIADAAGQVDIDSNDAVVAAQKIGEQRAAEAAQSKSIIASYTGG